MQQDFTVCPRHAAMRCDDAVVPWSAGWAVNQGWRVVEGDTVAGTSVGHVQATIVTTEADASAPAATPVSEAAPFAGPLPASTPAGEQRQTAQTPQKPQQVVSVSQATVWQAADPQPQQMEANMAQPDDPPPRLLLLAFAPSQGNSALMSTEILSCRSELNWFKPRHSEVVEWMEELHASVDRVVDGVDLTHEVRYDWKRYLASRPDAAKVIGQGITRFEFRYLYTIATDSDGWFFRGDLVAHRVDGSCVRLHPRPWGEENHETRVKEAIPIYGRLEDWQPPADQQLSSLGSDPSGRSVNSWGWEDG